MTGAAELGGRVSISSLRVDNLRPEVLRVLAGGGTKTVTVAPEAGSERMREAINKGVSEEQVLRGAALVGEAGLTRFKLYFMIGLPGEEDDDVHALAQLGNRIKERLDAAGHGTRLVLSVSPLVPKPWTAYQYETQMPPEVNQGAPGHPQAAPRLGHRVAQRLTADRAHRRRALARRWPARGDAGGDAGRLAGELQARDPASTAWTARAPGQARPRPGTSSTWA